MAGYVLNMSILVPNIIHCGQKDLSSEVRHKAYARPLCANEKKTPYQLNNYVKSIFISLING